MSTRMTKGEKWLLVLIAACLVWLAGLWWSGHGFGRDQEHHEHEHEHAGGR